MSSDRTSVPDCLADQFPSFDLTVLSAKQLAVVEMRLCGDLSWRKIAAFEGVRHSACERRFNRALCALAGTLKVDISH